MNKYCIECGEEIPEVAKFCPKCRTKQPQLEASKNKLSLITSTINDIRPPATNLGNLQLPSAEIKGGVDLNLYDIPVKNSVVRAQIRSGSSLIVFSRTFFGDWVNVFYLLPTNQGVPGWVEAESIKQLSVNGGSLLIEELPVSNYEFNDRQDVKLILKAHQLNMNQRLSQSAGCNKILGYIAVSFILFALLIAIEPITGSLAAIATVGFLFYGLTKYSKVQVELNKTGAQAEMTRLNKLIKSKRTPAEIELQNQLTMGAFHAALDVGKYVGKSEYRLRRNKKG